MPAFGKPSDQSPTKEGTNEASKRELSVSLPRAEQKKTEKNVVKQIKDHGLTGSSKTNPNKRGFSV